MANWYDNATLIESGSAEDNVSSAKFPELRSGSYEISSARALWVKHPSAGKTINGFAIAKDRKLSFIEVTTSDDKTFRLSARQLQREASAGLKLASITSMTELAKKLKGKTLKVLEERVDCVEFDRTQARNKWVWEPAE